jgi:hypothetical protein
LDKQVIYNSLQGESRFIGKSYQELLQMSDSDVVSVLQRKDYRPGKDARYDKLEPLLEEYSRYNTKS